MGEEFGGRWTNPKFLWLLRKVSKIISGAEGGVLFVIFVKNHDVLTNPKLLRGWTFSRRWSLCSRLPLRPEKFALFFWFKHGLKKKNMFESGGYHMFSRFFKDKTSQPWKSNELLYVTNKENQLHDSYRLWVKTPSIARWTPKVKLWQNDLQQKGRHPQLGLFWPMAAIPIYFCNEVATSWGSGEDHAVNASNEADALFFSPLVCFKTMFFVCLLVLFLVVLHLDHILFLTTLYYFFY